MGGGRVEWYRGAASASVMADTPVERKRKGRSSGKKGIRWNGNWDRKFWDRGFDRRFGRLPRSCIITESVCASMFDEKMIVLRGERSTISERKN